MINKKKLFIVIFLIAFIYLLILQVMAVWPFTIDDMYISLRYAKNWAAGDGLLWNINEFPVEGYSNFSFVVLAAIAIKLGSNPVIVLKLVGWMGLFLTTYAVYLLSRFWFSKWAALLPCVWLLLYNGQIIWAASGLETTIYQAIICFALVFLLRGTGYRTFPDQRGEISRDYIVLSGFFLALASLTRPEAPFLMLLFYVIAYFDTAKKIKYLAINRKQLQPLLLGILAFSLVYVPYFIWRIYYFGRVFPNPIYCKAISISFMQLDMDYLQLTWPFFLLSLPAIWKSGDRRHYYFWLPSIIYLLLLSRADPIVAFYNRLFLPVFVLLLPLAFLGLWQLLSQYFKEKDENFFVSLVVCALIIAFFFIPMTSLADFRIFSISPQRGEQLRLKVVNWLTEYISPGSHVLLADSGLIPYLSPLAFIDSYCLNNSDMTRQSNENMYNRLCTDTFLHKPDVIILTSQVKEGRVTYAPADKCLHDKLPNSQAYTFRAIFKTADSKSSYNYEIYTALK